MAAKEKEVHSDDFTPAQRPAVDLSLDSDLNIIRKNEDVIVDPVGNINNDYFEELAFNEQELTIRLEPTQDKNAPLFVDVSVNGETIWIPVNQTFKIKRKFVGVLASCKNDAIDTFEKETHDGNTIPDMSRRTSIRHPFSVIQDPDQRGYEWLVRLHTA